MPGRQRRPNRPKVSVADLQAAMRGGPPVVGAAAAAVRRPPTVHAPPSRGAAPAGHAVPAGSGTRHPTGNTHRRGPPSDGRQAVSPVRVHSHGSPAPTRAEATAGAPGFAAADGTLFRVFTPAATASDAPIAPVPGVHAVGVYGGGGGGGSDRGGYVARPGMETYADVPYDESDDECGAASDAVAAAPVATHHKAGNPPSTQSRGSYGKPTPPRQRASGGGYSGRQVSPRVSKPKPAPIPKPTTRAPPARAFDDGPSGGMAAFDDDFGDAGYGGAADFGPLVPAAAPRGVRGARGGAKAGGTTTTTAAAATGSYAHKAGTSTGTGYKPKTLSEYKARQPKEYVELGTLGPDLDADELVAKRANAARVKHFSEQLRRVNAKDAPRKPPSKPKPVTPPERLKAQAQRQRALEFAKNVPKPKVTAAPKTVSPRSGRKPRRGGGGGGGGRRRRPTVMSEVDELEAKHDALRAEADAIRRQFGL